jgi:tetratricopeptide (TPR) repeat protein
MDSQKKTATITLAPRKPGRNEPCHCGTGIKYKKCCLDKDSVQEAPQQDFDFMDLQSATKRMIAEAARLATDKNLSAEDIDEILASKILNGVLSEMGPIEMSDEEMAQGLIEEAVDEPDPTLRKVLIDKALALYPHLPYAWLLKAEDAGSPRQVLECLERAVAAGEADLGESFMKENEGHFWGMTETRPYMRAKAGLAHELWQQGREDEAVIHLQDCLRLNPNDNQGIRDVLLNCLLVKNDLDGVEKLLEKFKDDFGASHAYSKALFFFKKHGPESKQVIDQLEKSTALNGYVGEYLVGKRKLPKRVPDYYSPESKEEAIIYVEGAMRAWKETPGALDWLSQALRGSSKN